MKTMLKPTLLASALLGAVPSIATASLIFSDEFDYTAGVTLESTANWIPANTGTAPVIADGNLTVSGLPAATGKLVSFASGNIQEALATFGSLTTTGTVYYSFAFQLSSLTTATAYSFALSTGNTNYGAPVFIRPDAANAADSASLFNLGLANRSNSTANYAADKFALNTTIFVVGSYSFVTGTGNDTSSLWINPSSTSFGGVAPAASLTASGGTDLTDISQFLIRGVTGSASGLLDSLRVGTTWADVTAAPIPEPSSTVALAGLVVLGAVASRRRRA